MKVVGFLRNEHRDRVWRSASGEIWFFDTRRDEWVQLLGPMFDGEVGFCCTFSESMDDEGPFTEVAHTHRYAVELR